MKVVLLERSASIGEQVDPPTPAQHGIDKRDVLRALRDRELLEPIPTPPPTCVPLDIGVPGFTYQAATGLALDDWLLRSAATSVADLLDGYPYVFRRDEYRGSDDPADVTLYRAARDLFPPRPKLRPANQHAGVSYWYSDLVAYGYGELPTGELWRSLGHWNPSEQIEIFEALLGTIAIIVAGFGQGGEPYLSIERCSEGELCFVPPGAWHLTYVLDGPAVVLNVFTERATTDECVRGRLPLKYSGRPPVEIALVRDAPGSPNVIFSDQAERTWRSARPLRLLKDLKSLDAKAGAGLGRWMLSANPLALATAEDRLRAAWSEGWFGL